MKADWFNTRLTTSLAVFRIEQDHVASSNFRSAAKRRVYLRIAGRRGQPGVEFELNGALTDNWQLTFGATRYVAVTKTVKR
ncbi:hypothetical protein ACLK1Y_06060 [Escherichia coli]